MSANRLMLAWATLVVLFVCACALSPSDPSPVVLRFDVDLIHRLPPSTGEWISREALQFAKKAERKGLSLTAAYHAFTGDELRAELERDNSLRVDVLTPDGELRRWGWIENHSPAGGSYLRITIRHSPEGGTYRSANHFKIYPGHDAFGRYQTKQERELP